MAALQYAAGANDPAAPAAVASRPWLQRLLFVYATGLGIATLAVVAAVFVGFACHVGRGVWRASGGACTPPPARHARRRRRRSCGASTRRSRSARAAATRASRAALTVAASGAVESLTTSKRLSAL